MLSPQPGAARIKEHLLRARRDGPLLISPIIYAELLATPNLFETFLNDFLAQTGIGVQFTLAAGIWTEAGRRFAKHALRRRKALQAGPRRILADFLIGAHAMAHAERLMTFDTSVYRQDFPELLLYPELPE